MRILFVDSGFDWGGGQYQVLNLAGELRSRNHEMLLVCQRGSVLERKAADSGVPVETVRMRGDGDVPAWSRLGGVLRAFEPDVLHAHTGRAQAVAIGATFFHDVDALLVTRRVATPIRRGLLNRLKYSRFVTGFVAISDAVAATLVVAGVPQARIRVIHSSIRTEDFQGVEPSDEMRRDLALKGDEPIVLNVGRLSKEKAQEDVLSVARIVSREVPNVRFLIAGDGRLREKLEARARELKLESIVSFLGFREDVPDLMKVSSVFLFPSVSEGLGTSLLEAMAAGLPVVCCSGGGPREIVKQGVTGFLFDVHDVSSMARGVVRLLREPALSASLGNAARDAVKGFSFGRSCTMHEALYMEVTG